MDELDFGSRDNFFKIATSSSPTFEGFTIGEVIINNNISSFVYCGKAYVGRLEINVILYKDEYKYYGILIKGGILLINKDLCNV